MIISLDRNKNSARKLQDTCYSIGQARHGTQMIPLQATPEAEILRSSTLGQLIIDCSMTVLEDIIEQVHVHLETVIKEYECPDI